jgi:hypothetical protein
MAQFYASIQGNRGEATRVGTKDSGLFGHIRGWYVGAQVEMVHINGKDVCRIYLTGGSTGRKEKRLLGCFTRDDI